MSMSNPGGLPLTAADAVTPAQERVPLIAPPTEKAAPRVIAAMVGARLGLMVALSTPLTAGLVLKLQTLVDPDAIVGTLGLVTSLGALSALLFDPIFGRLSDRTTSRFGRRRPWMLIGAAGLIVALAIIALAPNAGVVALGWVLGQMLANAAVSAHTATLADQLPSRQRGKVSGMIGIAQQAAALGAAYAAQFLGTQLLLLFLVPGVIGFILVAVYALVLPDQQLPKRPRSEGGFLTVLKTFWVNPLEHPDFALAWGSRFLLVLANFMFITFRLLWIQNEFGLTPAKAAEVMATGVLCYTISLIVAGQIAGWLSDKIGRRKPFIVGSALIFAVGTYMLTHVESNQGFFLAEVVLGIGFGIYVAVDLALVLDVLPSANDAAKDLGVFNIAMAGPQVLAPGASAILIGLGAGQNFDLMLVAAAVIAILGAVMILPVKTVK
ncbi:MFS transporter [Plantibacter sp. MCCC 1A11337]|uniref:MFS transporter n=1 Tax=Plantibacter sp. MCCC 1A11337 TaxID=2736644 RepID=UPI0020C69A04|nr:MFS transporter [Plantibacter sp. MCCC 1A11337]